MSNINKKEFGMELNKIHPDINFSVIDNEDDTLKIKMTSPIFNRIDFKPSIKEKIDNIIKGYTSDYVIIRYTDNNHILIKVIKKYDIQGITCKICLLPIDYRYKHEVVYKDDVLETMFLKTPDNYNIINKKLLDWKKQIKNLKRL